MILHLAATFCNVQPFRNNFSLWKKKTNQNNKKLLMLALKKFPILSTGKLKMWIFTAWKQDCSQIVPLLIRGDKIMQFHKRASPSSPARLGHYLFWLPVLWLYLPSVKCLWAFGCAFNACNLLWGPLNTWAWRDININADRFIAV